MIQKQFCSTPFYILLAFLLFLTYQGFCQFDSQTYTEEAYSETEDDQDESFLINSTQYQLGWSSGSNTPLNETIGYYSGNGWGLISTKGKTITEDKYYTLEGYQGGLLIASVKDKFSNRLFYGTIDIKGKTIVPFKYAEIKSIGDVLVLSNEINHKLYHGLYSLSHKQITPINALGIDHFAGDLFLYIDTLNNQGLIHQNGVFKIPPSLDSISPCKGGYAKIFESGNLGLIDSLGQVHYRPTFKSIEDNKTSNFDLFDIRDYDNTLLYQVEGDSVSIIDDTYIIVYRNGFSEILNNQYKTRYSGYGITKASHYKEFLIVEQNAKYTVIKNNGKTLSDHNFDSLQKDNNYLYAQWKNKWYIYDLNGQLVSSRPYEEVIIQSDDLIPVKNNGYWGYINHRGKLAIPIKYDFASAFIGPLAQVDYVGFKSVINQSGKTIGATSYDSIFISNNQTAVVKSSSRTDIINSSGQTIFQTYNSLQKNNDYYIETTNEGHKGLITRNGNIIFYPEMDSISSLYDSQYFILQKGNQYAVGNLNGSLVIPFDSIYNRILHIKNGHIGVILNHKYGFVNEYNQLVIANRYDSVGTFSEGLCPIEVNGHWGYISKKEHIIVQPNLDRVTPFKNGSAIVERNGVLGVIDPQGGILIPIEQEVIQRTDQRNFIATNHGKYSLFNSQGNKVLGSSYDFIEDTKQGSLIVKRRGKYGVINIKGTYEIPLKYDKIIERANGIYICQHKKSD